MADLSTQIRDYFEATAPPIETGRVELRPVRPDPAPRLIPGWTVAVVAAVIVGLVIGIPALFLQRGDGGEVATQPSVTVATTAGLSIVGPAAGDAAYLEAAPAGLQLGNGVLMSRSGDTLWAWDYAGRVAGYRDGAWQSLPPLPDHGLDAAGSGYRKTVDVAGTLDGTVWALVATDPSMGGPIESASSLPEPSPSELWYLEGDVWSRPPEGLVPPLLTEDLDNIEVDPATGTVWMSSPGGALLSWDGRGVVTGDWGASMEEMVLDRIAVTADGTVWASRFNPAFPNEPAGLLRYTPDTGSWEFVRPLGGSVNGPTMLVGTPIGNLWVLIADVAEWPVGDRPGWEYPSAWVLAHFDSATGEWATYEVPDGHPGDLTGDDQIVWITHSAEESGEQGLIRFDGDTWTTHRLESSLDDLGMGDDGTIWVSIDGPGTLHRFMTEGNQSP